MNKPFRLIERICSFKYAFTGVLTVFKSQHNAWIHAAASIFVIGMGIFFNVSGLEWCMLVLAIMAVWVAESLNTAFEFLADAASPDFHPLVEKAKDVAAGAVLIAATGSAIIGLIIFVPYITSYLRQ